MLSNAIVCLGTQKNYTVHGVILLAIKVLKILSMFPWKVLLMQSPINCALKLVLSAIISINFNEVFHAQ